MTESESGDRSQRPPSQAGGRGRGFPSTFRDELTRLRGKKVGECAGCGKPVYLEQSFTSFGGRIVHLRCPIGARTAASIPSFVEGALARQATSRER